MILTGENGNTEGKASFGVTILPPRIPVFFLRISILGNGAQQCGLPPPLFVMAREMKIMKLELRGK